MHHFTYQEFIVNTSTTAASTNGIVCSDNDNARMLRLFVKIPKFFRKKDLRGAFLIFGKNVKILYKSL